MEYKVKIESDTVLLPAVLNVPEDTVGVVVIIGGNRGDGFLPEVTEILTLKLHQHKLATLVIELLTEGEARGKELSFGIDFLSRRLIEVIEWVKKQAQIRSLPIGLFGMKSSAALALAMAARSPMDIVAIVCWDGYPEVDGENLLNIEAPTLMIVRGEDPSSIGLNELVYRQLKGMKLLEVLTEAHQDEKSTLELMADLATDWLYKYLHFRFSGLIAYKDIYPGEGDNACY